MLRGGIADGSRIHAIHSATFVSEYPDVMDEGLGLL